MLPSGAGKTAFMGMRNVQGLCALVAQDYRDAKDIDLKVNVEVAICYNALYGAGPRGKATGYSVAKSLVLHKGIPVVSDTGVLRLDPKTGKIEWNEKVKLEPPK